MKKTECIIVGSGIAGITLAWELYRKNISFVLISQPALSQASLLAPGVWNPIVFKRITPTWNASELIAHLQSFYQYVENHLQIHLSEQLQIAHVLSNPEEEKLWQQKREFYPRFLDNVIELSPEKWLCLKYPLKCGIVKNAGRLKVAEYIHHSLEFFKSLQSFSVQTFHYNALIINDDGIEYDNISAQYIIFCEGHLIKQNPFFSFIQLKPAKGEILEIQSEKTLLPEHTVLHKNISIIPVENNRYLLGSNYEWKNLDETPTLSIKQQFLNTFENLFDVKYEFIGHYAGIRPALDRRPILGRHPKIKNMFVFNGLGTKGVMLAPFSAELLVDSILHNIPIPQELSVERFIL
ncbi:MAG: FAD-dependent oxidoreductase [Bacteroidia bacterium]